MRTGHLQSMLLLLAIVHGNRVTREDLQHTLDVDLARQQALPKRIRALQQPIDDLTDKLNAMQHDSEMTDDQRRILITSYSQRLEQAHNALDTRIRRIENLNLTSDEKDLLITKARHDSQPSIDQISGDLQSARESSSISEAQKTIVAADYQHRIDEQRPAVERLQTELNGLTAKIATDRNEVANWYQDYIKPNVTYSGDDWFGRLNQRDQQMNSGEFGSYRQDPPWYGGLVFQYNARPVGSFSTDGRTTLVAGDGMWATFDPRNDSPQVQRDLARLRAEAEFDRDHCTFSHYGYNGYYVPGGYYGLVYTQIQNLTERINNEH